MDEFSSVMPDVETATEGYARRFTGPAGRFLLRWQELSVQRLLGREASGSMRVLEVGGGHGQLTPMLLERGLDVWVQGSALGCADRIRPLMETSQGRLHFVVSSLLSLPFADRHFDLVIGIRLLAHVAQWQRLLKEMARVCRHRLLVDYPPATGLNALVPFLFSVKRGIEGDTRTYTSYKSTAVVGALRHEQFRRFAIRRQFLVPMGIHRAARSRRLSSAAESTCRVLGLTGVLGGPALLLAEREVASCSDGKLDVIDDGAVAGESVGVAARAGGHRILLVAPQPFFVTAGTPINVLHMCRALTELGHQVHLASLPMGKDVVMRGLHHHRSARVPFVRRIPIGFSLSKALCDVLLAVKVLKLLLRRRFVAVHVIEEAAFFGVPLAGLFGLSSVMDLDSDLCEQLRCHRSFVARQLAGLAGTLRRYALRHATCAVTVAQPLTELVARVSPDTKVFEIADVPLGLADGTDDPETVGRLRDTFGLDDSRTVLYTGNFDSRQGVESLVRAMPAVRAEIPNATLLLVGGELPEIREVRALAQSLGVAAAVKCAGRQPLESMPAFMELAAVLVSPRREPLVTPLKIYSYMASGRPIVATDLPTHTRVLDADSAVLVPPSPEGLASGIVQTLRDPGAAMERARIARQLVRLNYTFDHFKRGLRDVYDYVRDRSASGRRSTEGAANP